MTESGRGGPSRPPAATSPARSRASRDADHDETPPLADAITAAIREASRPRRPRDARPVHGRARRARGPPDVAVRRRHALVQTGVILAAVIGADTEPRCRRTGWGARRYRTTMPPHRMGGAPIPNHEAPHRMGGHGNAQRAHERDDTGGQGRHRRPKDGRQQERSGRGGTAPTSARPRYAADPDRRPRCHRRTSSSTPTRLAQVAGAGSTDRHTRESAAEPPQRPPPRPRSSVSDREEAAD